MRVQGPSVIFECLYCDAQEELVIHVDVELDKPPITIDERDSYHMVHPDSKEPLVEGEIVPGVCPSCRELGMPFKILGSNTETLFVEREVE